MHCRDRLETEQKEEEEVSSQVPRRRRVARKLRAAPRARFFDLDSLLQAEPAYQTLSMSAAAHPLPVKMAGLSQGQVMGATPLAFDTMEVSHTAYAPRYVCLLFSTCV